MKESLLRWSAFAIAACGIVTAACGGGGKPRLSVAAASDLRPAFEAVEPAFERSCGCDLTLTFGSSGTFATQIAQGLPVDVFASANAGYVDELEAKGLIAPGTRQPYAVGRIVIAAPASAGAAPATLDALAGGKGRIAIANPEHAPYGLAAKQALTGAGLWHAVEPSLVFAENASQAAQFVESGDAAAGIIPLSLAIQAGDRLRYVPIDESAHEPLLQVAAVVADSDAQALAADFIAYITDGDGRPAMREYGFVLPGETR